MMPTEAEIKLRTAHAVIAGLCCDIEDLFRPGAKVTVVVRNPGYGDADVLVSNDNADDVVAAIERLKTRKVLTL